MNIYADAAEWLDMPWWPHGAIAEIRAGWAGHDHEIVVNIEGFSVAEQIPDPVAKVFAAQLPDGWKTENRGSRIEVHPSGRLFGGYAAEDIADVERALLACDFKIGLVSNEREDVTG